METCKENGCNNAVEAIGLCSKHYMRLIRSGNIKPIEKKCCSIISCNKIVYAKEFCRSHYSKFLITGNPLGNMTKCAWEGCNRKTNFLNGGLCQIHKQKHERYKKHGFYDLRDTKLYRFMNGEYNPRWNRGSSEYKNHYKMKQVRKQLIERSNGLCENGCGEKGRHSHHIDLTKHNHELSNFLFLCPTCHYKIHRKK